MIRGANAVERSVESTGTLPDRRLDRCIGRTSTDRRGVDEQSTSAPPPEFIAVLALTYDDNPVRWTLCKLLGSVVPSVCWSRLSNLRLRDVPTPQMPGPHWVRLKTILGGICGTDLALIMLRNHPAAPVRSFVEFPVVLGHENVAVIDEVGQAVSGWSVGQRVVVEPSLSCVPRGLSPPCRACSEGRISLCENFRGAGDLPKGTMIGLNNFTAGSWAPSFVAHESQLHAVPDEIPDETAVLIDPIACSLHGVLRCRPQSAQRVLIQGGGVVALGVMMSMRALGMENQVTCLVRSAQQGEWLYRFGASEVIVMARRTGSAQRYDRVAAACGGRRVPGKYGNQMLVGGYDVVYDCGGSGRSLTDAMKFARAGGSVVALGTSTITLVDTTPLWFSELNVYGAYGRQLERENSGRRHTYALVMDLIRAGRLAPGTLLTHTFRLGEYRQALATLHGRSRAGAMKVAFRHGD